MFIFEMFSIYVVPSLGDSYPQVSDHLLDVNTSVKKVVSYY